MTYPLKFYLTDAEHIFNLNVFTITNIDPKKENKDHKKSLFWRNVVLKFENYDSNARMIKCKKSNTVYIKYYTSLTLLFKDDFSRYAGC